MTALYAGSICGTSLDGIDVALVEFPTESSARVLAYTSVPLSPQLSAKMSAIVFEGARCNALTYGTLDQQFGIAIGNAVLELLADTDINPEQITALGSHGINLLHAPDESVPVTLQIGDPNQIARITGITTVVDFRRGDVALGGQGAPLAPAFHSAVFSDSSHARVVLNLGGIANITVLAPGSDVTGFDTGPANGLLDAWYRHHHAANDTDSNGSDGGAFDHNGDWAKGGQVNQKLLSALADDPYFSRSPPKSTGKEHFNLAWLKKSIEALAHTPDARDIQATLAELTAYTVSSGVLDACPKVASLLVCGGGAHNADLLARISHRLPDVTVTSTEAYGVDPDHVEAAAFAWLAKRTLERKPGNLASVTGADRNCILGGIYYP